MKKVKYDKVHKFYCDTYKKHKNTKKLAVAIVAATNDLEKRIWHFYYKCLL